MNRGDAQALVLNINVDGRPIEEDYADDIEITFNPELHGHSVRKTLKEGGIYWEEEIGKFYVVLTQEDTFTMLPGPNTWQLRLLRDMTVLSNAIGKFVLGDVNSKHVLT